jgi:transcription antitermination factor NusG
LAEQQAVDGIREQGFWTYLPLIAATRRDRYVEIPLFPGYGFAAFDRDADPWGAINYTRGVMGLISSAGKPTACPPGAVEALMAGEGARRSQTPCAGILRPLEAVSVVAGPFRGHPGQVVAVNGARAVVTLMAFGGLINVHVAVADLRAGGE